MPHCHRHVLAKVHQAGPTEVRAAVAAAREAWRDWSAWSLERRAAVFLKAADLLAGRYRSVVNAATMLGQSKTAHQAEIDAACELIDFFRFNLHYAERIYAEQPLSAPGTWNALDHRPLEGFVYAITPFNFTSIGGNLPTAPAIMGNTVVWKPAGTAAFSNYFVLKLLEEAGLPPGVINFVPGPAALVSEALLAERNLAGIHFTGSTEVFQSLWQGVARNLTSYAGYPRLVARRAARTSSWRTPAPTSTRSPWPSCAGPTSIRARSAAPPRAPTCRTRCGPTCASACSACSARSGSATRPTSATSWGRSSIGRRSTRSRATSRPPRKTRRRRSCSAARATTRMAISSSPR